MGGVDNHATTTTTTTTAVPVPVDDGGAPTSSTDTESASPSIPDVLEEGDPLADELAIRTARAAHPDVAAAFDDDVLFHEAFATTCDAVSMGEQRGSSVAETVAGIVAAVPSGPEVEHGDDLIAFAIQTFLFYDGCGHSRLARDVRVPLLEMVNEAFAP